MFEAATSGFRFPAGGAGPTEVGQHAGGPLPQRSPERDHFLQGFGDSGAQRGDQRNHHRCGLGQLFAGGGLESGKALQRNNFHPITPSLWQRSRRTGIGGSYPTAWWAAKPASDTL